MIIKTATDKLYFESPYIVDGHKKLYGEVSIFDLAKPLIDEKAATPIFKELILSNYVLAPKVKCLKADFFIETMSTILEQPYLEDLY